MHELSVSIALLDQAADVAQRHGARAVSRIALRIGPLAGIEPALLRAAYEQAQRVRAHTFAAGAELVIAEVPVRILCRQCGAQSDAAPNRLDCPACGSAATRLLSGDEMLIETMDLVFAEGASSHV